MAAGDDSQPLEATGRTVVFAMAMAELSAQVQETNIVMIDAIHTKNRLGNPDLINQATRVIFDLELHDMQDFLYRPHDCRSAAPFDARSGITSKTLFP